jgi:hypothetical protein
MKEFKKMIRELRGNEEYKREVYAAEFRLKRYILLRNRKTHISDMESQGIDTVFLKLKDKEAKIRKQNRKFWR